MLARGATSELLFSLQLSPLWWCSWCMIPAQKNRPWEQRKDGPQSCLQAPPAALWEISKCSPKTEGCFVDVGSRDDFWLACQTLWSLWLHGKTVNELIVAFSTSTGPPAPTQLLLQHDAAATHRRAPEGRLTREDGAQGRFCFSGHCTSFPREVG